MPKKGRQNWEQVTIPKEFRDAIERVVEKKRDIYGYSSLPEFMRDAIRRLLIDLGHLKNE